MDLAFEGISKSYPGVNALSDVSFRVRAGSVHALCGENGAGKSTLLKILSGVVRPDRGTLTLAGEPMDSTDPADAIKTGIAVIYQELHLAPEMTVAENILIGNMSHRGGVLDSRANRKRCRAILSMIGSTLDPDRRVRTLSIAQRQMVEIAKALSRDARVIAFDEPTSSLSSKEATVLFQIIRNLKEQGRVILYVSHRMEEILSLCDACTVLRDGRHVETFETMAGVSVDILVSRMVGRDIADVYGYRSRPLGEVAMQISALHAKGLRGGQTLTIRKGEVVGLFGLVGAGRSELLAAVYGLSRRKGEVKIDGAPIGRASPRGSIDQGMFLSPEDRKHQALFLPRSVQENLNIAARRRHAGLGMIVNESWERRNATAQIERLRIKTPSRHEPIVYLSGGNQQKAVLGRWLSGDVRVLLLDEPTRGIDVGAKREIYDLMFTLAEGGASILFVSSDLPEVMGVADRILVMREGAIVGNLPREEFTEAKLLSLALPDSQAGHSA